MSKENPLEGTGKGAGESENDPAKEIGSVKEEKDGKEKENGKCAEELEDCKKKAEEYKNLSQRLQAEFENYRKRMERAEEERARFCSIGIIKDLLPVLDTMDDAIKHCDIRHGGEQGKHIHHEGIKGVRKQLMAVLERNGLSEIFSKGKKFNPEIHDCAAMKSDEGKEEDYVLEEIRKGYLMHNKVLRPAIVIVNRKEEKEEKSERKTETKNEDK